jgi:hypothetical protein
MAHFGREGDETMDQLGLELVEREHGAFQGDVMRNASIGEGVATACRYQLDGHVHTNMSLLFFTRDSQQKLLTFPMQYMPPNPVLAVETVLPGSANSPTLASNIRIATFQLSTDAAGEVVAVELIPTENIPSFYSINLIDYIAGNVDHPRLTTLVQRLMIEMRTMQRIPLSRFQVSFDIYYDRNLDHSAGGWHQDADPTGTALIPDLVSLQYVIPVGTICLGPELLSVQDRTHIYANGVPNHVLDMEFMGNVDGNSRFLIQNGTVVSFLNMDFFHASPETDMLRLDPLRSQVLPENMQAAYFRSQSAWGVESLRDPRRLDISKMALAESPVLHATRTLPRSFLRIHCTRLTLQPQIVHGIHIDISNLALYPRGVIVHPIFSPDMFFGGGYTLVDFKIQNKFIRLNFGPFVKINTIDIPKHIKQDAIFIKNIIQQLKGLKGGKYRFTKRKIKRKKSKKRN